ncbi:hypothetical protein EON62_02950 [archaeon]|nr:MAG: hypothetical protein EON62_02950 [archaeon]
MYPPSSAFRPPAVAMRSSRVRGRGALMLAPLLVVSAAQVQPAGLSTRCAGAWAPLVTAMQTPMASYNAANAACFTECSPNLGDIPCQSECSAGLSDLEDACHDFDGDVYAQTRTSQLPGNNVQVVITFLCLPSVCNPNDINLYASNITAAACQPIISTFPSSTCSVLLSDADAFTGKLSPGAIAGVVVGITVSLLLVYALYTLYRRKLRAHQPDHEKQPILLSGGARPLPSNMHSRVYDRRFRLPPGTPSSGQPDLPSAAEVGADSPRTASASLHGAGVVPVAGMPSDVYVGMPTADEGAATPSPRAGRTTLSDMRRSTSNREPILRATHGGLVSVSPSTGAATGNAQARAAERPIEQSRRDRFDDLL